MVPKCLRSRRSRISGFLLLGILVSGCGAAGAQNPDRWEGAMQDFEVEEAATPVPPGAIVFTGSSSVRLWTTLQEDMAPLTVIQRGFGGSVMADALYWIDTLVLKHRPRAVVLYEGDNDIGSLGMRAEELLEGYETFVMRVHEALPDTRIYFLAVKPSILRWDTWAEMKQANDLIRQASEADSRLFFIDVASPMLDGTGEPISDIFVEDDLHMNAKGYEIWTSVVRPFLMDIERAHEPTDLPIDAR